MSPKSKNERPAKILPGDQKKSFFLGTRNVKIAFIIAQKEIM